jgi:hypothetical protein
MRAQRGMVRFAILLVTTSVDFACGGGDHSALCVPGEQKACACFDGKQGAQACNAAGSGYDACEGCGGGRDMNTNLPFDMSSDSAMNSKGDISIDAAMSAPGDAAIACTQGKSFCIANQIWQCTLSGSDATLKQTCDPTPVVATSNNSYTCFEDCSSKGINTSPCCTWTKPRCRATFTSDPTLDFTSYVSLINLTSSGNVCEFDMKTCNKGDAGSELIPTFGVFGVPTLGSSVSLGLALDPAKISPGQTKNLSDLASPCANENQVSVSQGGTSCTHLTGTVTWTSGPPSFSISFNLTCTETGKSGVTFVASFTGEQ